MTNGRALLTLAASQSMLNRDAANVMTEIGVSAATDITGYGLIGHLLEMCTGSGVGVQFLISIRLSSTGGWPDATNRGLQ